MEKSIDLMEKEMEKFSDKELENFQKVAFDYALYKTGNLDIARDISSQTISLFLLSFNQNSDPKKWILNTSKIYCKKYFDTVGREQRQTAKYRTELIDIISEQTSSETNHQLNEAFKDSFNTLTNEEFYTILTYFNCNQNLQNMLEIIEISYDALRKKISRIKRKLKAETYRRLGYFGTKRIVTPQLDNLIIKFLKRLKTNLENDSLHKMYYYFSEVDLSNYQEKIHIKKIIDYDIELNNSIYKAWVFYRNPENEPESFTLEFYVDNRNHLKIVTPPTKIEKPVVIDMSSLEGKKIKALLAKYPEDKTGRPSIPPEELERIIKDFENKSK
ncbi:MAG: hypothetical protein K9N09_10835 [Candidatus Cloacimonetes bacterium]|nr:hypothetical protein [Candidatus Cloacimonadota bacterium]MCF7869181.1 hypothetical protein [Candidatus Cloacimonadota bacterium]